MSKSWLDREENRLFNLRVIQFAKYTESVCDCSHWA